MTTSSDQFLTVQRVREVYSICFRPERAIPTRATVVGWIYRHTFSIRYIQKYREDIIRMLLSLPAGYRSDEGQGGSVGMMGVRGDGTVWTMDVTDVEKLVALGIAAGLMSFCAPREAWHKLPNRLPYVRVEITRFGVSVN